MKKFFSLFLSVAFILGIFAFVGCGKSKKTLNLGFGVYTTVKASDATEDKNGQGQAIVTGAVVLVDGQGKIAKCLIDCADSTVAYTADGEAVTSSFATKYEQGAGYGMKAYGGATLEWFEQADAFCGVVIGKTLAEVKRMATNGSDELIRAGCTIDVADFIKAIEKAVNNAVPSEATANDVLKLGVSTSQSKNDATEDASGYNQIETTFFAAAVNEKNKIVAATADCVQVKFTFDANGASAFDATKPVESKYEQKDAYNMKKYGGAVLEWYEQADAFCALTVGKTPNEVSALLADDDYGTADVKAAGCTIRVDGFEKAASKVK